MYISLGVRKCVNILTTILIKMTLFEKSSCIEKTIFPTFSLANILFCFRAGLFFYLCMLFAAACNNCLGENMKHANERKVKQVYTGCIKKVYT